jgi:hypothetical protein
MSLGHHGSVFVGEINKFVDSAKANPMETWAFPLDYSLPSAFLHWHFSFLTFVLMDFWWRKLLLLWSASFIFSSDTMHCPFIIYLESESVDFKFLICFLLCLGISPSEIWKWITQFFHHDHHVFPSVPLPFTNNVETSLLKAMSSPDSHHDHTSALGNIYHYNFPTNVNLAPWEVYFPCCLNIIVTFMSGPHGLCAHSVI